MRRLIVPASLMATLLAAFALYAVKYDTRRLQVKLRQAEQEIERVQIDIDVLKAERAHLARPARLETLARRQGLRPVISDQIGRVTDAPLRPKGLAAVPRAPSGRR